MKLNLFVLGTALAATTFPVASQVLISAGTYAHDFNTLASSGTSNPWTDNSTLPGWYASKSVAPAAITTYRADNGAGNAGALYSYGLTGSGERALGSLASGTPGALAYGIRFLNDTAATVTNVIVSYTGEQWRNSSNTSPSQLTFAWRVATALTNSEAGTTAGWTAVSALSFTTPIFGPISLPALDGNAAGNRTVFSNVPLPGVTVAPGQELFLRWHDENDTGFDHGQAVDDLVVAFGVAFTNPPPPAAGSNYGFSLLTYNVKGNGATDWSTNSVQVQAIARQLQYLQPDVITFNEIPFDLRHEMTNFAAVFLPGYQVAISSGTDGAIVSAIASRYPITRSSKWLDGVDLRSFGYSNANNILDNFTRDLFEAQIAVPHLPRPVHVFTTHLKATSGITYAEAAAKRAAEAAAITNFFATNLLALYPYDLYTLSGDLNDSDTNAVAIQNLLLPMTGLRLTNPRNPTTSSINTYSTTSANPSSRLDYILPNALLFSNIQTSQVFRTDLLNPLPAGLNSDDGKVASDHLPVFMVFNNPFAQPVQFTGITRSNPVVNLTWNGVFGQPYRVEASSNLTHWSALATNVVATNASMSYRTNLADSLQFIRVYRY